MARRQQIWLGSVLLLVTTGLRSAESSTVATTPTLGSAKAKLGHFLTAYPARSGVATALLAVPMAGAALQRLEGRLERPQAEKALAIAVCLGLCAWLEAGRHRTVIAVTDLKTNLTKTSQQLGATSQRAQGLLSTVAVVSAQLTATAAHVKTVSNTVDGLQAVVAQQAKDLTQLKGIDAVTQTELEGCRELRSAASALVQTESGRLTTDLKADLATQTASLATIEQRLVALGSQQQLLQGAEQARQVGLQALDRVSTQTAVTVREISGLVGPK